LAFLEAAALTNDNRYLSQARLGIRVTQAAQDPKTGGWKFASGDPPHLTGSAWHIAALVRFRELDPPDKQTVDPTLALALSKMLPLFQRNGGSKYVPWAEVQAQPADRFTVVGLAMALQLGTPPTDAKIVEAADRLRKAVVLEPAMANYFIAQLGRDLDDDAGRIWSEKLVRALAAAQEKPGTVIAGSWYKHDNTLLALNYGRVGVTAMNVLALTTALKPSTD
jgi:hypothetical protein